MRWKDIQIPKDSQEPKRFHRINLPLQSDPEPKVKEAEWIETEWK